METVKAENTAVTADYFDKSSIDVNTSSFNIFFEVVSSGGNS